jgi:hypothetical protein
MRRVLMSRVRLYLVASLMTGLAGATHLPA